MIVKTLSHGKKVIDRLFSNPWVAFDTETKAIDSDRNENEDALVFGRPKILVWSACHKGESYSFPTRYFDKQFPRVSDWVRLLYPYFSRDRRVVKVAHNMNYDANVFYTAGISKIYPLYCTMIGAWMADVSKPKGLKERASEYGRNLINTSVIKFDDLDELAEYAESDVIQTDEMYQMQMLGRVERPRKISFLSPTGKIISRYNTEFPDPADLSLVLPPEVLTDFDKLFLNLQEFPFLKAVLRAERTGFPFDSRRLKKIQNRLQKDLDEVLERVYQTAGKKVNLNSGPQLEELFQTLGIENPHKTDKGRMSFRKDVLVKLMGVHPIVKDILNYGKLIKLQTVYVGRKGEDRGGLLGYVLPDGRIHATINPVGAVTGRTTCGNPNLQNQPSRADIYGIRKCYIAPRK